MNYLPSQGSVQITTNLEKVLENYLELKINYSKFENKIEHMGKAREQWIYSNYPLTDNQIKYNQMMLNYDYLDEIINTVCDLTRTTVNELFSKTKDNHITTARYLVYYFAKENGYRLNTIVRYMNTQGFKTTTSTVIYGIKQIDKKIIEDEDLRKLTSSIIFKSIETE